MRSEREMKEMWCELDVMSDVNSEVKSKGCVVEEIAKGKRGDIQLVGVTT